MLNIYIFLIVGHINENRVFLTTFGKSCCPVDTFGTRQITESIEITPSRITDICGNVNFKIWLLAYGYWLMPKVYVCYLLTTSIHWQQRRGVIRGICMRSKRMSLWENAICMKNKLSNDFTWHLYTWSMTATNQNMIGCPEWTVPTKSYHNVLFLLTDLLVLHNSLTPDRIYFRTIPSDTPWTLLRSCSANKDYS